MLEDTCEMKRQNFVSNIHSIIVKLGRTRHHVLTSQNSKYNNSLNKIAITYPNKENPKEGLHVKLDVLSRALPESKRKKMAKIT